jgi:hypothetical protein
MNKQIVRDTIIYNMNTVISQMDKYHKLYNLGVDLMEYDSSIYKALEDNTLLMLLWLAAENSNAGKEDDEEFKTTVLDLLMWVLYERDCKSGFDITDSETGEVVANVEKPEDFVKYIESLGE